MTTDDRIARSLERISKTLITLLIKDLQEEDQKGKIKYLKQCGLENTEIAAVLDTTPNTVNVAIHSLRKKKSRSTSKKRKSRKH